MKLNEQTKLMYMTEHLLAIEDLIKDNIDEALLAASIRDIKFILERQMQGINERKGLAR
tara:strand:- start:480 stop:656 length:177 start_codon:yes stop_codon:yes gene_type:complete